MLCYALKEHLNVMLMIIRGDAHAVCAIDWIFFISLIIPLSHNVQYTGQNYYFLNNDVNLIFGLLVILSS